MGRVIKATAASRLVKEEGLLSPQLRAAVIDLAVAMARRIVGTAVENDPRVLEKIFTGALAAARGLEGALVHVHPLDRNAFDIDAAATAFGFTVCTDPGLLRGGCRIVGEQGEIDAAVETITDAFKTVLEGAQ